TEGAGIYNDGTLDLIATAVNGNVAKSDGTVSGQHGGLALGSGVYSNGQLSVTSSSVGSNLASANGSGPANGGIAEGAGIENLKNDLSIQDSAITTTSPERTGARGAWGA